MRIRDPKRFWRRLSFWSVTLVTLSQILAFGGVYSWSWVPAELCLLITLPAICIGCSWGKLELPWHPLFWTVLAFGALVYLQWSTRTSVNSAETLTGLLQLTLGGTLFYLAFHAFQSERNLQRLGTVLWIFAGALAAEAIAQYFTGGKNIYWFRNANYATPVGPFLYHNYYAGAMDLLIPPSIAIALRPIGRAKPDRLAIIRRMIFPALALASVVVSESRGGLFTLLIESLVAFVVYWPELRRSWKVFRNAALTVSIMLSFTLLAGWQPMITRILRLEYHDASALDRMKVAISCVHIWRHYPWIGAGFNTFASIYPKYQIFDSGQQWLQAHNEYAQSLAETGTIGAFLILSFIVVLVFAFRKYLGMQRTRSIDIYRKACLVALVGFLFHSYGDFLFHCPADMLLFFLICGAFISQPPKPENADRKQAHTLATKRNQFPHPV